MGDGGDGSDGGYGSPGGYMGVGSSPGSGEGAGFGDASTGYGDSLSLDTSNPYSLGIGDFSFNDGIAPGFSTPESSLSLEGPNSETFLNKISKFAKNSLMNITARNMLGPIGPLAILAGKGITGDTQGAKSQTGGMFGALAGGMAFGPIGAALGGIGGSMGIGALGPGGAPAAGGSPSGSPWGEIGSGLYGLYRGGQANNQANTLGSLYGQNSPYAQYLRSSLERRDAAAGRRSQYGPREVELQAKLADMYSRNYPMLQGAQQRRDQLFGQGLGLLFQGANRMGYLDGPKNYLNNLFSGDWYSGGAPGADLSPSFDTSALTNPLG